MVVPSSKQVRGSHDLQVWLKNQVPHKTIKQKVIGRHVEHFGKTWTSRHCLRQTEIHDGPDDHCPMRGLFMLFPRERRI